MDKKLSRLFAYFTGNYKIKQMGFYPPNINEKFRKPENAGALEAANAQGTGASFVCGAAVRFFLRIDARHKQILEAKFKTNACGFAVAAAQVLAEKVSGEKLTELHGMEVLREKIEIDLGKFDLSRKHCAEIALNALQNALADFRRSQVEEFQGEKALICSCFGVSEETIESIVAENYAATVEEVGEMCNAGTGCGSCRFLIQDLIDASLMGENSFSG